jgi:TRAP-type uncharacterized transport system fused permease subunit
MYWPALLLVDASLSSFLIALFFVAVAFAAYGIALEGFLFRKVSIIERIILVVGAILLIFPSMATSILGTFIVAVLILYFYVSAKRSIRVTTVP